MILPGTKYGPKYAYISDGYVLLYILAMAHSHFNIAWLSLELPYAQDI